MNSIDINYNMTNNINIIINIICIICIICIIIIYIAKIYFLNKFNKLKQQIKIAKRNYKNAQIEYDQCLKKFKEFFSENNNGIKWFSLNGMITVEYNYLQEFKNIPKKTCRKIEMKCFEKLNELNEQYTKIKNILLFL